MNPLHTLPGQLFALFLGWIFTIYLQHRANLRAETIRRKDKTIDKIDKLVDWVEKQTSDDKQDISHIEAGYTATISQIEIRIKNINALTKSTIIPPDNIAKLRNIDIVGSSRTSIPHAVRESSADLIEELEMACSKLFFEKETLREKINRFHHEFAGIFFGLMSIIAFIFLIRLISF